MTLTELWLYILFLIIIGYFFFDEEPFFDFTDWNILHIILIICGFLLISVDYQKRADNGTTTNKDRTLLIATFAFWQLFDIYVRIIIIGFCFHSLTVMEIELIDTLGMLSNLINWTCSILLPSFIISFFIIFGNILLNYSINLSLHKLKHIALLIILSGLISLFLITSWDLIVNGLNSMQLFTQNSVSNVRTPLTYETNDIFEWHKNSSDPFIFKFEHILTFFIQLLNVINILSSLLIWLNILSIQKKNTINQTNFVLIAVGSSSLHILIFNFIFSFIVIILIHIQIYTLIPLELFL